jgi:thiopurine S-methyltransferase
MNGVIRIHHFVIPAKAGIHLSMNDKASIKSGDQFMCFSPRGELPAYAGMTREARSKNSHSLLGCDCVNPPYTTVINCGEPVRGCDMIRRQIFTCERLNMENDYWLSRWQKGDIKFHQLDINPYLLKYYPLLALEPNNTILVPLCGKTQDMLWLQQQQLRVVGVELSDQACSDFFKENDLEHSISQKDNFIVYQGEHIELFCGDFFELKQNQVGKIKAVYDRAAMIALPLEYRQRYVDKIVELTEVGSKIVLISLESGHQPQTPPFVINEKEIIGFYQKHFKIQILEETPEHTPHLIAKGYDDMCSVVYLLTRKTSNKCDIKD